ncbi:facilitated trehalose transporter Tret1-2 homolog [Leptopilina heterotoma]|uniref:facilitated trehalose transporter Tret1-2 homolog n=1 Tax=Leptopilina heterotoma TaxID=63436 RepID=UPI001CA9002B|nr:facilitated trehalose transporter Tret1-2 homolog [Leptopilina heterotoma]XP_043472226.1 facilitated trehalose transporter Tret1-2 homolog [Leptopilina heterotoma]
MSRIILEMKNETTEDKKLRNKISNSEISHFLPEKYKKGVTENITSKDAFSQIFASCLANCIVIQVGIHMAFSTVFIEDLKRSGKMTIDKDNESWITSLMTIGVPIGSLLVGPLMDKFGRKKLCLFSCIPMMISWLILIMANSINLIYISRFIAGFSSGLTTVGLIYVSEITHPRIRPMMLSCNSVFVSFGILITCCLPVWLNWLNMAIVFLIINCLTFFGLFFIPESPYWYLCLNKKTQKAEFRAERSLRWLNRREKIFQSELSRLRAIVTDRNGTSDEKSLLKSLQNFCHEIRQPTAYKPLTIISILLLIQQLSGCYVIIFYAISVFKNINSGNNLERTQENDSAIYGALVLLGVVRFFMSILTAYFSKIYGRRILCISSGLGMSFSMFFSAMYMYLTTSWDERTSYHQQSTMLGQTWILIVIILFYICMSAIGFMVIPWTLTGELLPISIKGCASGFVIAIAYVVMFGVMKTYLYVLDAIGTQGIFFFFSFISILGTAFVYVFLPETLGKSFADIEKYFIDDKKGSAKRLRIPDNGNEENLSV